MLILIRALGINTGSFLTQRALGDDRFDLYPQNSFTFSTIYSLGLFAPVAIETTKKKMAVIPLSVGCENFCKVPDGLLNTHHILWQVCVFQVITHAFKCDIIN